jgi:hypothetical protein
MFKGDGDGAGAMFNGDGAARDGRPYKGSTSFSGRDQVSG